MTGKTTIEWCSAVWNPTTGCTRVSEGCTNCYAFALHDKRFKANVDRARSHGFLGPWLIDDDGPITTSSRERGDPMPFPKQYDLPFSRVQLLPDRLDDPLRHRKPERYFVDSMADLFHEDVPDEYLDQVFAAMMLAKRHTFLVLTKRPERMRDYMLARPTGPLIGKEWYRSRIRYVDGESLGMSISGVNAYSWPPANVWLGTSVEDQASADERIPHLLATPAAVRFLSCEPLLGPVDLTGGWSDYLGANPSRQAWTTESGHANDRSCHDDQHNNCPVPVQVPTRRVNWVIIGGESGARARPMDLAWLTSLVESSMAAGVPVFVKQDSGARPGRQGRIPDELWIREFPR